MEKSGVKQYEPCDETCIFATAVMTVVNNSYNHSQYFQVWHGGEDTLSKRVAS